MAFYQSLYSGNKQTVQVRSRFYLFDPSFECVKVLSVLTGSHFFHANLPSGLFVGFLNLRRSILPVLFSISISISINFLLMLRITTKLHETPNTCALKSIRCTKSVLNKIIGGLYGSVDHHSWWSTLPGRCYETTSWCHLKARYSNQTRYNPSHDRN